MNTRQTLATTLMLFCPFSAALPQQSSTTLSLDQGTPIQNAKLTIRHYQRLAQPIHKNIYSSTVEAHFSDAGNFSFNLDYGYDLSAKFLTSRSSFAYSIASLYLGQSYSRTRWRLGRKVLSWNPIESYWGHSQLNGQEGFSPIATKQEGLIGFHAEHTVGGFTGEIFASYLFLPKINPEHYVEDNRIQSSNEWGSVPPEQVRIGDGIIPIRYSIHRPITEEVINDIVLNPSLGISLHQRYKLGTVQGSLRTYGLYKPENSLRFLARNIYRTDTKKNYIDSTIVPFVHYHTLWGVALSHQVGGFTWDIHASRNSPLSPDGYQSDTGQGFFELHEAYYNNDSIASSFSYRDGSWNLGVHYLHAPQVALYKKSAAFLSSVPHWHKSWGLSLQYRNNTWNGLLDVKYDTFLYNTVLKSELSYRFPFGLSLGTRAEIIQSPQERKPYNYWSNYRTNDSFQTYLSYNF